jgi:hypothetical protein
MLMRAAIGLVLLCLPLVACALALVLPSIHIGIYGARILVRTIGSIVLLVGIVSFGRAYFLFSHHAIPGFLLIAIFAVYSTLVGLLAWRKLSPNVTRQVVGLTFFVILIIGSQELKLLKLKYLYDQVFFCILIFLIWLCRRTWQILIAKIFV